YTVLRCCNVSRLRIQKLIILLTFACFTLVLYGRHFYLFKTSQFPTNFTSQYPFFTREVINPYTFEYVIQPRVNCSGQKVELVICVINTGDNHSGRSVIRKTWGSYAKDPNNKAVLLFFIGWENGELDTASRLVRQSKLQEEASTFGDIVQENYLDSYRNLTLKSVSILRWVNLFCPNTKYILKVDDDVYMNIPFLMSSLEEFIVESSPPSAFIIGYKYTISFPKRNPTSKWYTPFSVYRELLFPSYVTGLAYVMTSEAGTLIYEASLRVTIFWLEDIYITGMCAREAHVPVYHSKYFTLDTLVASGCSFRTMVCSHRYSEEEMVKIHREINDKNLQC
ncbi:unnamed protein product, partial [Candidula unifasciata]